MVICVLQLRITGRSQRFERGKCASQRLWRRLGKYTRERLKALYGKQFSFNLSANEPKPVCLVSLRFPFQLAE